MKKIFFASFLLFTATIGAAESPIPTADDFQKAAQVIITQRNQLGIQLLDFQAQLLLAAQEIESLKKQLADAQAKLAAAEKQNVPASKNPETKKP